jgi:5'-AMP-activated protein kinase catalytic alpha subunit
MENRELKVKTVGHYNIGKTIGQGTFGKVKLGFHTLTNEKVAVKILEKDRIKDVADVERVAREIHILKLIRHPNIIQLYEVTLNQIIETPRHLFLIMEYASGGELFDFIVSNTRLNEPEACKFYQQIISGVEYIHKLGVVHRDLKPENLLLDCNKNIKIVDFGLSNTYKQGELLQTACGSPCYAAPEMIAGHKYSGSRVDLWSSGVILFAMVSGYLPFEDPNTADLYKKILGCEYEVPSWVSHLTKEFLSKILDTNPETRFTISQIRQHPWFNQVKPMASEGILVGYSAIPINKEILQKLEMYNIDQDHGQKCIEANKHNHVTTTYYLLLKKHHAHEGVVQVPSEKSVPRPPLLPFAPLLSLNIKPLRHRKYVEKKVEGTGGSSSNDLKKQTVNHGFIIKSNSHIKENSPNFKNIRGRRYVSTGKTSNKSVKSKSSSRTSTRPSRLKTQKVITVRNNSSKQINSSFDYRLNTMNSSFKKSPKFHDLSFFLNKLR